MGQYESGEKKDCHGMGSYQPGTRIYDNGTTQGGEDCQRNTTTGRPREAKTVTRWFLALTSRALKAVKD